MLITFQVSGFPYFRTAENCDGPTDAIRIINTSLLNMVKVNNETLDSHWSGGFLVQTLNFLPVGCKFEPLSTCSSLGTWVVSLAVIYLKCS